MLKTQSGKVSKAKAKSIASPYITAVLRAEHVQRAEHRAVACLTC